MIEITKHKAVIPIPWRVRLKLWWAWKRMSPRQRELIREFDRLMLEAFLYGG